MLLWVSSPLFPFSSPLSQSERFSGSAANLDFIRHPGVLSAKKGHYVRQQSSMVHQTLSVVTDFVLLL